MLHDYKSGTFDSVLFTKLSDNAKMMLKLMLLNHSFLNRIGLSNQSQVFCSMCSIHIENVHSVSSEHIQHFSFYMKVYFSLMFCKGDRLQKFI